ncbi:signal peptidase I [Micromonospora sp. CPCC 205371]|nr:signal peptidase I [Micromonospora sp. CPCC 205371]
MTASETPTSVSGSVVRRCARAILTRAVRRGAARGGVWGEAVLAEMEEARTDVEAIRWAAGGLWVSWRERTGRVGIVAAVFGWLFGGGWIRRLAVVAVLLVGLALLIHQFVLTVVYVPSVTMEPGVRAGDRVLVDRVGFRLTGLDVGDTIVVSPMGSGYTLRVVGLPGDELACRDGKLFRNGSPANEPYLAADTTTECQAVAVPDGHVYLLGDNRASARDSRVDGPMAEDKVAGRVVTRVSAAD